MVTKKRKRFIINPIRILSSSVASNFDELESLAKFIESSITKELKWWEEYVDESTKDMSSEDASEFAEIWAEDYQRVDLDFRLRLRYSFVVTTYGVIESRLNRTCRTLKGFLNKYKFTDDQEKILIELEDINEHSIIQRARKYLEKVLHLSFPKRSRAWQEITMLAKVRNFIVHSDGYVSDTSLDDYVAKNPKFLEFDKHDRIVIQSDYNDWIIEQGKKLFTTNFSAA